jgi:Rod binding domain-containing protein
MDVSATQHSQLVKTTQIWVAQAFYGPLFKQMRSSSLGSDMFNGGRGGEVFQAQLDQRLAERMAGGKAGQRLVNSIVRQIENKPRTNVTTSHRA